MNHIKNNLGAKGQAKLESLKEHLPPDKLRGILRYEPETGKVYWKTQKEMHEGGVLTPRKRRSQFEGREALTADTRFGYYRGTVEGFNVTRHAVVWALVKGEWPEFRLEFIDKDGLNTRIENLRPLIKRELPEWVSTKKSGHRRSKELPVKVIEDLFDLTPDWKDVVWDVDQYSYEGELINPPKGKLAFSLKDEWGKHYMTLFGRRIEKYQVSHILCKGDYLRQGFSFADNDPTNIHPSNIVLNTPQD